MQVDLNIRPNQTFIKYLILQIPGWLFLGMFLLVFRSRLGLPGWALGGLVGAWVLKDLLLYPVLRRAYEGDTRMGAERLVGSEGHVVKPLRPVGYIRVRGELWRAETRGSDRPIPKASRVRVVGARGLTLKVEPK